MRFNSKKQMKPPQNRLNGIATASAPRSIRPWRGCPDQRTRSPRSSAAVISGGGGEEISIMVPDALANGEVVSANGVSNKQGRAMILRLLGGAQGGHRVLRRTTRAGGAAEHA